MTCVEKLVIVAVVAILACMVYPAFVRMQEAEKRRAAAVPAEAPPTPEARETEDVPVNAPPNVAYSTGTWQMVVHRDNLMLLHTGTGEIWRAYHVANTYGSKSTWRWFKVK